MQPDEVRAIARDAYVYAYPIVTMDMTMRVSTNVPAFREGSLHAPVNQFAHVPAYPAADVREVVRVNFDTLYSVAWLDVAREPIVLSVPDTAGRYYLMEMLDMWTDVFAVVGRRTTGTGVGNFAIVAVDFSGALPPGVDKIVAPTSLLWLIGRTQTNGPSDYANVHKVQSGYKLTPLSQWGKAYTPPRNVKTDPSVDEKTPPKTQVDRLDGVSMLARLSTLFGKYPPHPTDYPILFRMRALGLEPGKTFDPEKLEPAIVKEINAAAKSALADLKASQPTLGRTVNGWSVMTKGIGTYGASYKERAMIALGGLGANLPEDAIYPLAFVDADGQTLNGANKYVLHFDKGKTPPAHAFWSLTMYDEDGFQVANPINRFAIGDRDKLALNADGSLDLYVQADAPDRDKLSNWLPAPKNAVFQPALRIYSPRSEVEAGSWVPPAFKRAS